MWTLALGLIPVIVGTVLYPLFTSRDANGAHSDSTQVAMAVVVLIGLVCFAILMAVNSAVHSYLIVAFSKKDKVAKTIGFYYMANAGGRLVGILTSGFLYSASKDTFGISICMW